MKELRERTEREKATDDLHIAWQDLIIVIGTEVEIDKMKELREIIDKMIEGLSEIIEKINLGGEYEL